MTTTPSPLAVAGSHDMWQPVPFGVTPRGHQYALPLARRSHLLIGGEARTGRTNALAQVVAAAALDPHARLVLWSAKPERANEMWAPVCAAYGADTDGSACRRLVGVLTDLYGEMQRRYQILRDLDGPDSPARTVTPDLARDLDMPLTLVAIDGVDRYLADDTYGTTIRAALHNVTTVGRAGGIVVALTTSPRRPLPPELTDQLEVRFATRTTRRTHSRAVLGPGHLSTDMDPSAIPETDRGAGVLVGADPSGCSLIRTYLLDRKTAAQLAGRARDLRGVAL